MKVDFWVVVRAKRSYYDKSRVAEMTATTLRQGKPSLKPDEIAIKVSLEVDTKAFSEPVYAVSGVVPDGLVVTGPALTIEEPPEDFGEDVQDGTPVL